MGVALGLRPFCWCCVVWDSAQRWRVSRQNPRKTPKFLAAALCSSKSAIFSFFALLHLFEGYLQNRDNIIVEMQQASQEFLKNRIIAYASRLISGSLQRGDRVYNYPTVISIILVDFSIRELAGREDFVQHVMLKDDRNEIFSEKMSFLLIDLSKFATRKSFGKLSDDRQKWCYAIKNMWQMKESDIPASYDIFHELYEECKLSKLNDMEKQEYEKSILEYEDVKEAMDYNRRLAKAEGFSDGFEKGMEKGRREGIWKKEEKKPSSKQPGNFWN